VPDTARNILVVDDEESIADLVSSALRFAGYDVTTVHQGYDALRSVKTMPPDLAVLDVNLPDISGFDVCRKLRHDGHSFPVIFLTARDQPEDLRAGFGHGGDDYLTKPFSLEELALRIEAVLRRSNGGTQDQAHRVAVGDIVLDEDAHLVTVDDAVITLSPTEFRLLHYLMLNSGRVLSKGQILDYVWEYDFDGNASVVETYVSYLRKKLGDGGSHLETVRGVGYVLRP
jgi:two-component system OmpR family response regulator